MKKKSIHFILILFSVNGSAQNNTLASFPNGDSAFDAYIVKNLYITKEAKQKMSTGKIQVKYTIAENGKVISILSFGDTLQNMHLQIEKLFNDMPTWRPTIVNGRAITTTFNKEIIFDANTQVALGANIAVKKQPVYNYVDEPKEQKIIKTQVSLNSLIIAQLRKNIKVPKTIAESFTTKALLTCAIDYNGIVTNVNILAGIDDAIDNQILMLLKDFKGLEKNQIDNNWRSSKYEIIFELANRKIKAITLTPFFDRQ